MAYLFLILTKNSDAFRQYMGSRGIRYTKWVPHMKYVNIYIYIYIYMNIKFKIIRVERSIPNSKINKQA